MIVCMKMPKRQPFTLTSFSSFELRSTTTIHQENVVGFLAEIPEAKALQGTESW